MVESTFCTLLIEIDPVVNCTGFVVHIWGASFLCLCLSEVSDMCFSCGVQGGGAVGQCSHFYMCVEKLAGGKSSSVIRGGLDSQ